MLQLDGAAISAGSLITEFAGLDRHKFDMRPDKPHRPLANKMLHSQHRLQLACSLSACNVGHALAATRRVQSGCGFNVGQAVFAGSDLQGTRFIATDLQEADLSDAKNYEINPTENRLKKTRFSQEAALDLVAELGVIVPR